MTRLVTITRTGPAFQEPRSLETLLEDSVTFEQEKWLQLNCVASDTLPSEYALAELDAELERVVSG